MEHEYRDTISKSHGIFMATVAAILTIVTVTSLGGAFIHAQNMARDRLETNSTHSIILYAQGGDASHSLPNSLSAFRVALNSTRYIKTDVFYTLIDGQFVIQTRNGLFFDDIGAPRTTRCNTSISELLALTRHSRHGILTLNETFAFAKQNNVTLLIQYHACSDIDLRFAKMNVSTENKLAPEHAIIAMDKLGIDTFELMPSQIRYMVDESRVIANTSLERNISGTRFVLTKPIYHEALRPEDYLPELEIVDGRTWNVKTQANYAIGIDWFTYTVWPSYIYHSVYNETQVHMRQINRGMEMVLRFSAAKSIETPDPSEVVAYVNEKYPDSIRLIVK